MSIRIGISGWTYEGWRGTFYSKGLPRRKELEYASRRFDSIEINGTFYRMQRPENFAAWYDATPADFRFAVKGSRFITHMKQLRSIDAPLANFFASGVLRLEEKLGPILWQFPARMRYDEERFHAFLRKLPRSSGAAAVLARKHDARVSGRAWMRTKRDRPLLHAIEVREPTFFIPEFMELLRFHNAALVFSDSSGEWPYAEDVTANFLYLRLHGAEELYASGYGEDALGHWARRISSWSRGSEPADAQVIGRKARRGRRDVYVYFDNDRKVRAPFDAQRLRELVSNRAQRKAA